MRFWGEYRDNIEDGKVDFPWSVSEDEKLNWMIVEITGENLCSIHCEICDSDELEKRKSMDKKTSNNEKVKILSHGELFLDVDEKWQVPEDVLEYLKTDEITFLGAYNFVEIFSAEDMMKCEKYMEDSLKELETEEGFLE